ncbi:glycosyltransferase family 4 protein [Geobacter sp.]|uniref:glycosyltransferase family 4 protein n=1 Tax=Geobacter sp. TaxID=46610 RepID=UPI0027B9A81D|nr:glycosyltransferase family 4 protein [Geobacter sp.]
MKLLIVTQYFWPENFRINDLVSGLIERGCAVTVLTGIPNYPEGRFFPGYGFLTRREEEYQGARVVRVPLIPRGSGGGTRLALNYLSFLTSAAILGSLRCRDSYDAIFVFEPSPVTVALPALFMKALRKIPVLLWVQDLWPESIRATGAITSQRVLDRVADMVRFIYRRCDRILITSRSFRSSILQYSGTPGQILYFPQCAEAVFQPAAQPVAVPELAHIPPGFRVMFAGNIGAAQDFETIIGAAERLRRHGDIHWVIVGDGRMREWAENQVQSRQLQHTFHFLGKHDLEKMPAFFSNADAMLVTLKKEPIFALTVPAKIQSYLACGRPIIAALDGEGATIVAEADAGFTCPTEDPAALAEIVLRMYATAEKERERMGISGRRFYEANFDRNMLLDRLVTWIDGLTAVKRVSCETD